MTGVTATPGDLGDARPAVIAHREVGVELLAA